MIHFVATGFSALGMVWRAGQELEVVVGSPQWELTVDRGGNSWLDIADNPDEQVARYGVVFFASGLRPSSLEVSDEVLRLENVRGTREADLSRR